jgi:ABC-type dipeptide/oligopeptide/nickel transport system permease subunit
MSDMAASPLALASQPLATVWQPRRLVWFRTLCRDRSSLVGLTILVVVILAAILAPLIATHDPTALDPTANLAPPSRDHWLGTDNLGRDLYSRLIYGGRWSIGASAIACRRHHSAGRHGWRRRRVLRWPGR